jgi:2-polyprenyl-3-methyl-5-hydroxy-6-metoxy-1,4-benzoquinol methylase
MRARSGHVKFVADVDEALEVDLPQRFSQAVALATSPAGRRVLDVGCWTGGLLGLVAAHDPRELVGVDIPGPWLQVAQRRLPGAKLLPMGNFDHFPDELRGRFDTVFFLETLEHLPRGSETTVLRALGGLLAYGGELVLSTPAAGLATLWDPAWLLIGHRHYRRATLIRMLADGGLEVERVCYQGNTWTSIDTFLFYGYKHLLRRRYVPHAGIARREPQTLYPVRRICSTNIWLKAVVAKAAHRMV